MTPPILFLIFNRPDLTQQSFASIREAQPKQLFIAADGPRPDREGEAALCEETRSIVAEVDWECDVKTLFREENLGCRQAVSSAISWFFEHVEEGIILEDDCVADPTFFPFCADLLTRYRDDERVMCITGNNFQQGRIRGTASYYFSVYNHCWGWATWRRAWQKYDLQMTRWPEFRDSYKLNQLLTPSASDKWREIFNSVFQGSVDTWDYQWTFSCWLNGGLTATPNGNLVRNIGFDHRATHTTDTQSTNSKLPVKPLVFPLVHPAGIEQDKSADQHVANGSPSPMAGTARSLPENILVGWARKVYNSIRHAAHKNTR